MDNGNLMVEEGAQTILEQLRLVSSGDLANVIGHLPLPDPHARHVGKASGSI